MKFEPNYQLVIVGSVYGNRSFVVKGTPFSINNTPNNEKKINLSKNINFLSSAAYPAAS